MKRGDTVINVDSIGEQVRAAEASALHCEGLLGLPVVRLVMAETCEFRAAGGADGPAQNSDGNSRRARLQGNDLAHHDDPPTSFALAVTVIHARMEESIRMMPRISQPARWHRDAVSEVARTHQESILRVQVDLAPDVNPAKTC